VNRRTFSLHTVQGLIASGLLAGAVLAVGLVGWRLVLLSRGEIESPPDEPEATSSAVEPQPDLRERSLLIPVQGIAPASLRDNFNDARGGGLRVHHALDIMAARGTPVLAVEDGRIVRLHHGGAGGITVYQLDGSGRYGYYYAHLDRYADGLAEGQKVTRGDVLGFVGTTGNAPATAPHLHFAIYEVEDAKRPWRGRPIDPYPLWR
jgi:murein DD-endopeptidase MepM/ murein hydrolase activator NlpD